MKVFIISLFSFFISVCPMFSQNFSLLGEEFYLPTPSPYGVMFIDENHLKISWRSKGSIKSDWDLGKVFKYQMHYEYGMPYIYLGEDIPEDIELGAFSNAVLRHYGQKFLFLVGRGVKQKENVGFGNLYFPKVAIGFVLPEDKRGSHVFLLDIPNYEGTGRVYSDATSELIENGIIYKVGNLDNLESDTPWVEGEKGDGIGESFVIKATSKKVYPYLLIINGFISASRPQLYSQNGRIKKIKVEGLTSGKIGICSVLDTPHPQTVDISIIPNAEDVKITILEVYPGTKYRDTAIHYLITWDEAIIPYESNFSISR